MLKAGKVRRYITRVMIDEVKCLNYVVAYALSVFVMAMCMSPITVQVMW